MNIVSVEPGDASPLARLTFPAWRHILEDPGGRDLVIAAARSDAEDVGLAFAWITDEGEAELVSVYVDPLHRSDDLLRGLLRHVEAVCRTRGCHMMGHQPTIWEDDHTLAGLLVGEGWSRPMVRQLVCSTTVTNAQSTPWLMRAVTPKGYGIIDWSDVSPVMRAELKSRANEGHAFWPKLLDPFRHEQELFHPTSVALVSEGCVRGWILCHIPSQDTVRWTASWVDEDIQGLGYIVPLWKAAVARQATRTDREAFMWSVPRELPRMCRFVTRRMRPWLSRLGYAATMIKRLDQEA